MHSLIYHIVTLLVQLLNPVEQIDRLSFTSVVFEDFDTATVSIESLDSLQNSQNLSVLDHYNLALAYHKLKDTSQAKHIAQSLLQKPSKEAQSQAYLMLSNLALQSKDTAQAITILGNGIDKNRGDDELLYNFELLKKKFKNSQNRPPRSPQNQTSSSGFESGQIEKSDQKEDELETSNPPKISRKQALQILETLKEKEILFIPKSSENTKDSTSYGKM